GQPARLPAAGPDPPAAQGRRRAHRRLLLRPAEAARRRGRGTPAGQRHQPGARQDGQGRTVPPRRVRHPRPLRLTRPGAREDRLVMGNRYLEPVLAWYGAQARDLPWRRPDASPWAVLVSEFMLQQTPVSRVLPAYAAWLERWPDAPALAASPPGEAVRQWGTLGYPRRALRLHETARILTKNYGGQVPASVAELVLLPGVGAYTAAAVA